MLFFFDIYKQFPNVRGIKEHNLRFEHVSIFSDFSLVKGLFIPIHDLNLNKAIENGAIAALWKEGIDVPSYTPNHFPIIFVKDPLQAFLQICEEYVRNLKQKECEIMTKIAFYEPGLLNNDSYTYDIAGEDVRTRLLETVKVYINSKRRG